MEMTITGALLTGLAALSFLAGYFIGNFVKAGSLKKIGKYIATHIEECMEVEGKKNDV